MPLMQRELQTIQSRSRLLKGIIFFLRPIILVTFNILPTAAAFLLCVLGFARIRIIDSNFYREVDWPIIIMLAAMIPIGTALQTTGLSEVISSNISNIAADMSLFWLLFLILIITMATTDIINNAATAVIMAPISLEIANQLNLSAFDARAFLLTSCIAASASFITPIGYQTNTFVYTVGGYKFSDFAKIGIFLNLIYFTGTITLVSYFWGF